MIKRITLKTIEFTAACIAVSLLFAAADTALLIMCGEFSRGRECADGN